MHFSTPFLATLLLASTALSGPIVSRNSSKDMDNQDLDDDYNIFKHSAER
jgi:hypothetical protein